MGDVAVCQLSLTLLKQGLQLIRIRCAAKHDLRCQLSAKGQGIFVDGVELADGCKVEKQIGTDIDRSAVFIQRVQNETMTTETVICSHKPRLFYRNTLLRSSYNGIDLFHRMGHLFIPQAADGQVENTGKKCILKMVSSPCGRSIGGKA